MGIQSVLGLNPVDVAKKLIGDQADQVRRTDATKRVALYQDDCEADLLGQIRHMFTAPEVQERLRRFSDMACATSVFRRVVDETARPVYNPFPARRVSSDVGATNYATFIREARLDQRLDLGARLLEASNSVFLFPRWVPSLQRGVLDILTPDQVRVIPHPDDPTTILGFLIDLYVHGQAKPDVEIWDDESVVRLDPAGNVVRVKGELARPNPYGKIPIVDVHRRERWGAYWDTTSGKDLIAAQRAVNLLTALVLKLHKSQGEKQIVVQGDTASTIQNQTLDGEGALVTGEGVTITTLDLRSDANHYNATIDSIIQRVAANYGISKERLAASGGGFAGANEGSDTALYERRQELLQTWSTAEQRLFDLCKLVFKGVPGREIPPDDKLIVDFRDIEARVSMSQQLELWEKQLSMGLKSVEDMVISMNPEISTSEEASATVSRNLESWAKWIGMRRELNAPADASDPGQSPQDNGAQRTAPDGVDQMPGMVSP
jgi:hypothetical protein